MPDVALLSEKRLQVRNLEFSLDHAFSEDATQKEVYDIVCRQAASQVLQGLSVCVLAYGQTGSGKTHTMLGSDGVMSGTGSPEHMGICLRAIADLFAAARAASGSSDALGVTCSYVEIYNDQCNDLLGRQAKALSLREGRGGLVVDGLCVQPVASPNEAVEALAAGNAARTVAQMSMNRRSSRSHALFTITVPSTQTSTHGHVQGKLVLVDLAGMETSKTSVGVEKDYPLHGASSKPMRREEARHINTSLCALSSVIERLAALKVGSDGLEGHVPFRNSKLTRMLKESLHGTGSTAALVATLRAGPDNLEPSTDLPWPSTGPRTDLPPTFHGLPPDLAPTFD